jgi:glutamate dehydrogenase
MVLQYLSEKPMSEMAINAEEMQLAAQHVLNSYALVHDTSGVFLNQMIAVYNNIAKTQFFTEHTVRKEVDSFYSQLNLDPYYFHIHEPSDVSTHLLAYLTAKLHAESVGDSSACEYLSELPNSATYISGGTTVNSLSGSERIARKFQQRMSEKYFGDAEFSGINEEPTDRKSVIGDDAPTLRSFYSPRINFSLVSRSPFVNPNPAPGETDIWQLATVKFLEDRSIPTLKKFENLLSQASGQLMPVIDTYNRPEAGIVTMVVKAGSTDGLLRDASVIFDSCGQKAEKVYMDYFSNGYVIFNWHLSRPLEDSVASEIRDHLNWSWLLPKNTISDLMTSGQLSAPELGYTYSAWKYAYHFLMRQNDELLGLSSTVSHDPTALRQLQRLAKKVRMEVATEARCADSIRANVPLVKDLYRDFIARHKPGASSVEDIATKIENAPIEDETDREVLRAFLAFNENVLKTNFFKPNKAAVSYRLNPKILSGAFPEIPFGVFLVLGSEFRGFHVRFDDVARGGIRLIKARDRHQWERNAATVFDENYNLAWTQQNKNKDIPEGGSKGTIMLNLNKQKDGAVAFNKYIDAMLDLLLPGKDIVDHYKTPEILFFGPDEGTADFMDWAAIYARRRGYDYWRAITTGKSPKLGGIPHDVFGMTTLSVHECVLGILRKAGVVEEQTTKLQTGGPDGDLGSNELQISKDITKAVVDGSGVLFDPKGLDREELIRLAKSRKMIREFNPKKLSSDGFIVLVDQKDVTLPDGTVVESGTDFRNSFHLDPRAAADLFVPCGGRPESINATTVKKITPDGKPNFKYIVEGANLFLTQEARLYLENLGVVIVKGSRVLTRRRSSE